MKRSQSQLEGKIRWWEMLKSDPELVEVSGVTLESLRSKATDKAIRDFQLKKCSICRVRQCEKPLLYLDILCTDAPYEQSIWDNLISGSPLL
jgi:hypothetical protein